MTSKEQKAARARAMAGHINMPLHLKPGAVIVFEGLDGTGKSTQHERMERGVYAPGTGSPMFDGEPRFLHMPSGSDALGDKIYRLTEKAKNLNPVSRQLLHLASHAQELPAIVQGVEEGHPVFLDRFWWSTVAYGWKGVQGTLSRKQLQMLAQRVWDSLPEPDLICLFMHPHVEDPHNTDDVREGYEFLAELYEDRGRTNVVHVPMGHEAEQNLFIFAEMSKRGLYGNGVGR